MNKPSDLDIKDLSGTAAASNPITGEDYYNADCSWLM